MRNHEINMKKTKLSLYIMDYTPLAVKAIENLELLCKMPELESLYEPEVINLRENPGLVEAEKIIATPVLIRKSPDPIRRFIGDLSNHKQILIGLGIYDKK